MASFDANLLQTVVNLLSQTLNPITQKQAEESLKQLETSATKFPLILFAIVEGSFAVLEVHVRLAASLLLKNFVHRHWAMEDVLPTFSEDDRTAIKTQIVDVLARVPGSVQRQLCEIITLISQVDFPDSWPDLISRLVERLNAADFDNNLALLRTLHCLVKRYRSERRSDELYTEINYVMSQLASPLLEMYKATDVLLEANKGNRSIMEKIMRGQSYLNKIFYSLSSQDLPAFFEDHLSEFMGYLKKQFTVEYCSLAGSNDEAEAGPAEKLPTSVAKIAILYATRYEEDFTQLAEFVQTAWNVLTSIGREAKFDSIAGSCMRLLSSVAKQERHQALFSTVLQLLCDKVIVPNVLIRESDLEMFEDEPMEYIRTVLDAASINDELADGHQKGRRAGAILLTRGLMEFYEAEITNILQKYIENFLSTYTSAPSLKWRDKNAAVALFGAISIKGAASAYGVTRMNPMINLNDFFAHHVLPDLQPSNQALHPLLKVDAIRFVADFRSQLPKEHLVATLPLLQHHLASHHMVVNSATAITIERLLSVRKQTISLFNEADLAPFASNMITYLLKAIVPADGKKINENEFLMRCLLRTMSTTRADLLTSMIDIPLDTLTFLINTVSVNPTNPIFNHNLFESMAVLIKTCLGSTSSSTSMVTSRIDAKLIPILQHILQNDLADFIHYAFQLFAVMLEVRSRSSPIPDNIKLLIPPVLQPALWSCTENVPALVRFLQAALIKDPIYFVQGGEGGGMIPQLLGIFQTLVGSKTHDVHAFGLLSTMVQAIPIAHLQSYLGSIFMIIMKRLQSTKAPRLALHILLFICIFVLTVSSTDSSTSAATYLMKQFDALQPKLLIMVMNSLLLANATKIRDKHDRKLCSLGLIKLATECPELFTTGDAEYSSFFANLVNVIILMSTTLPSGGLDEATSADGDWTNDDSGAPGSAGSSFWRLKFTPPPRKCPLIDTISDPQIIFANSLSALSRSQSAGKVSLLLNNLDPNIKASLTSILQQSNTSI